MKKKMFKLHTLSMLLVLALFVIFAVGSEEPVTPDSGSGGSGLSTADGIIQLKDGLGEWSAAYVTKQGYFCVKNNMVESDSNKYISVTFMPEDGSDMVSLISTKNGNIPTQMVTKEGVLYFSFPNDSILELLYDNGKSVVMLDSIAYSKENLPGFSSIYKDDVFKAILANAASLLNGNTSSLGQAIANKYGIIFKNVSITSYTGNGALPSVVVKDATGTYTFVVTISGWYDNEITVKTQNLLSLWTGKATFKVGGSSCTLSGTIWCPSNTYNDYGTYGIICDADPSKLTVGNAEYEGTGYQADKELSYSVDFRGFKPNTTYYYRAYYKFKSTDHGSIIHKYGDPSDQVIYDTTIKTFTTGNNVLSVDVVMCIDVTGSMSGIINTVKSNAISFFDIFNKCCVDEGIQLSSLTAQVVPYRDKNEDTNWLVSSKTFVLPAQQADYKSFVNNLYADGGGDIPESGLEALQTAFNKKDWGKDDGYHRQVVILWTDAPYLIGSYSDVQLSALKEQWNSMPSGRRLILFAPYGTGGLSNAGSWGNLDGWVNLIHETNLTDGFGNFEYILKSIIGELTSKSKVSKKVNASQSEYLFRPNN